MLYRKSPPTAPRLLLRIVATAGAGALLAMTGCSSSSSEGSATTPPSDASADDAVTPVCGSGLVCGSLAAPPPDGGDSEDAGATGPCGGHVCGTIALPQDAGDLDAADGHAPVTGGDTGAPTDASDDATGPCHPVCGIIVAPDH
jgi:hypothetical protein